MHSALFVTHEDVTDRVLLKDLVIDREHRSTGVSKYDVDTLILQGLNYHFCSGHLRLCHRAVSVCIAHKKTPESFGGAWVEFWSTVSGPCAMS